MEMRWASERPRVPMRPADRPSFSSTLLDAICDSMDDGPKARRTTSAANAYSASRTTTAGAKKQEREAALHCYYYKPALASSYRAHDPQTPGATAADCSGRGYFSSSEVEYSSRRLRPVRTSVGVAPTQKQQQPQHAALEKKPNGATRRGSSRPASPGARFARLLKLNSIFSGKRPSALRTETAEEEPMCSTMPSYTRAKTPPRASRSKSTRTVRFLDIDGEVAVAAAAVGGICRGIPVVEVEEKLLQPVAVEADMDGGGEKSSDASSDLFELDYLADTAPEGGGLSGRDGSYGNELPVYGSTGVGLRRGIAYPRPYAYGSLGRSCGKVDF
ncbi:unnamed protein product [Alopecurus aequalis]